MGRRGLYRVLVERPDGKRPLGRPSCRLGDNIKMDFQEMEWEGMHWTDPAWDKDSWRAVVKGVMNLRVPYNARNFLTS
jgi:hypothetical protein